MAIELQRQSVTVRGSPLTARFTALDAAIRLDYAGDLSDLLPLQTAQAAYLVHHNVLVSLDVISLDHVHSRANQ